MQAVCLTLTNSPTIPCVPFNAAADLMAPGAFHPVSLSGLTLLVMATRLPQSDGHVDTHLTIKMRTITAKAVANNQVVFLIMRWLLQGANSGD